MKRLQQSGKALGTEIVLTVALVNSDKADFIFKELWDSIQAFEAQFSRFLADSELTSFNHQAGSKTSITPAFHDLLLKAKDLGQQTNGLYNPFVLPSLQRAGYVGSWPNPSQYNEDLNYSDRLDYSTVENLLVDANHAQIPKQAAIDFGGIGKGYLLDQLGATLQHNQITNYWLSLGGDILCNGHEESGKAWMVAVQHVDSQKEPVTEITNGGKQLAIATSGITKRRGQHGSNQWHHIIDPRTGQPAESDVLSATVTHTHATEADVFAKCLVILGTKNSADFVRKHGLQFSVLQTKSNNIIRMTDKEPKS